MISWRGYGSLVPLFWGISIFVHLLFNGWQEDIGFTFGFMLIISAIVLWVIGTRLNGDLPKEEAPHLFMWVPLQYCGLFYLLSLPSFF